MEAENSATKRYYLLEKKSRIEYYIEAYGIDQIVSIRCIEYLNYIVLKGINSTTKASKMLVLRTGQFTRSDRRVAAIYDLPTQDSTTGVFSDDIAFSILTQDIYKIHGDKKRELPGNFLILQSKNDSCQYLDLTGPNIYYKLTNDHERQSFTAHF